MAATAAFVKNRLLPLLRSNPAEFARHVDHLVLGITPEAPDDDVQDACHSIAVLLAQAPGAEAVRRATTPAALAMIAHMKTTPPPSAQVQGAVFVAASRMLTTCDDHDVVAPLSRECLRTIATLPGTAVTVQALLDAGWFHAAVEFVKVVSMRDVVQLLRTPAVVAQGRAAATACLRAVATLRDTGPLPLWTLCSGLVSALCPRPRPLDDSNLLDAVLLRVNGGLESATTRPPHLALGVCSAQPDAPPVVWRPDTPAVVAAAGAAMAAVALGRGLTERVALACDVLAVLLGALAVPPPPTADMAVWALDVAGCVRDSVDTLCARCSTAVGDATGVPALRHIDRLAACVRALGRVCRSWMTAPADLRRHFPVPVATAAAIQAGVAAAVACGQDAVRACKGVRKDAKTSFGRLHAAAGKTVAASLHVAAIESVDAAVDGVVSGTLTVTPPLVLSHSVCVAADSPGVESEVTAAVASKLCAGLKELPRYSTHMQAQLLDAVVRVFTASSDMPPYDAADMVQSLASVGHSNPHAVVAVCAIAACFPELPGPSRTAAIHHLAAAVEASSKPAGGPGADGPAGAGGAGAGAGAGAGGGGSGDGGVDPETLPLVGAMACHALAAVYASGTLSEDTAVIVAAAVNARDAAASSAAVVFDGDVALRAAQRVLAALAPAVAAVEQEDTL